MDRLGRAGAATDLTVVLMEGLGVFFRGETYLCVNGRVQDVLRNPFHSFDIRDELSELYLHRFLFRTAKGMISIFLPLFLYDAGFSVFAILVFYAIDLGMALVTSIPNAVIANRIGYRKLSVLSAPLILLFYWSLRSIGPVEGSLYLLAVLGGLAFNMYWMGMNAELSSDSHGSSRGRDTGVFLALNNISSIIPPLIGGSVIAMFGFEALFAVATALIFVSFLPFLFSQDHHAGMDVDIGDIFNRDHLEEYTLFICMGMLNLGKLLIWPLALALIIKESVTIGWAGSLRALGAAVFSIYLGSRVDDSSQDRYMLYGGVLFAATWIVMAMVTTPVQAVLISFLNGLLYLSLNVPVMSGVLEMAEREDVLEYLAFREVGLASGRVLFLLVAMVLLGVLPQARWLTVLFLLLTGATLAAVRLGIGFSDRSLQDL